jgi:cytochrome c
MKLIVFAAALAAGLVAAGTASATEALAKSSGCLTCHAVDKKKVGPPFKETAAKYKGKADAQATLVKALGDAKSHPEVKAKGDDLAAIVKWVLAQ